MVVIKFKLVYMNEYKQNLTMKFRLSLFVIIRKTVIQLYCSCWRGWFYCPLLLYATVVENYSGRSQFNLEIFHFSFNCNYTMNFNRNV